MSYSVNTFVSVMSEFIKELSKTFPEEKTIKTAKQKFKILKKTNPRKMIDVYMEKIKGMEELLTNNNEEFIQKNKNIINGLDISELWSKCSDDTKSAIWKYLNTLYILGTTVTAIPSGMMEGIEKIALECVDKMKDENGGISEMPDMNSIMKGMQNMLGGSNDMMGLLSSLESMSKQNSNNNQAE